MRPSATILAGFFLALAAWSGTTSAQTVAAPDPQKTIGHRVPDVTFTDDTGDTFRLSTLEGKPILVNPVFTSCPQLCPLISSNLRDAVAPLGPVGKSFWVLTVSFDPGDDIAALQEYRKRLDLPAGWRLAIAPPDSMERFLDALDFHVAPLPGGGFAHPNVVAVLTPDLRVSGYVNGLTSGEKEVRAAIRHASVVDPLVERFKPLMIAAALLAALAAVILIVTTRRRTAPTD